MNIIDFLIFNLTNWFDAHRNRLKWSTPLQRATYIIGIVTMLWVFNFWIIISYFFHKTAIFKPAYIVLLIVGIGTMQLYRYIYINRGRYERLNQANTKPFNASERVGQVLSIIIVFFSLIALFILIVLFAPPPQASSMP